MHTHTCISLIEEKSVKSIYIKVLIILISVEILNIINNLIGGIDRLLFSKQNDLLLKSKFLFFKKVQLKLEKFLKKVNIRKSIFEEVKISRIHQFVC